MNSPPELPLRIVNTAPRIFTANQNGEGVFAGQMVHVHADGSQTVENSTVYDFKLNAWAAKPIDLGPEEEQVYLILYGAGLRHGASASALVNGLSVPAVFAAQSQYPGLDQVNLLLHRGLAGAGHVQIVLSVDGQSANTVTASII